jgi:DNA replication protein DnaC
LARDLQRCGSEFDDNSVRRTPKSSRTADQGRDLLEILEDRHGRGSTIVTSQVDVKHWHEMIANPTVADAILDRLVHNAHRLNLAGESMRKAATKRPALDAKHAT